LVKRTVLTRAVFFWVFASLLAMSAWCSFSTLTCSALIALSSFVKKSLNLSCSLLSWR
jgi:hypothetical protein